MLMLLPEALLSEWHGSSSADYDRTCEVAESWLGPVSVNGGFGHLLGGDPGMALLIRDTSDSLTLVRWQYGEQEDELIEFALRREAVAATEPDLVFENKFSRWVMYDAAADPLNDRPPMRSFELPVARIRTTTEFLECDRNAAIVHTFRPDA
jgi:hypothetical protein